jgi:hypothetical protein
MDPALSRARFLRDIEQITNNPDVFAKAGIIIVKNDFPILVVSIPWHQQNGKIFLHIQADDYDYLPVEGWWVDENDKMLSIGQGRMPQGNNLNPQSPPYGENRSWFCYPGWRAYHFHPSHQSPSWENFRGSEYNIPSIITQLIQDLNKGAIQAV